MSTTSVPRSPARDVAAPASPSVQAEARLSAAIRDLSAAPAAVRAVPAAEWLMDTVGVLLHAPRGADALRALVLHLASGLQCDRVALGLRRQTRSDLEVLAVSDLPRLSDAAELVRDLHAAMQEAAASACTLTHPARRHGPMQAGLAHVQLSRAMGACAVCTVPLGATGWCWAR